MKKTRTACLAIVMGALAWAQVPVATAQTAAELKGVEEGQKIAEAQIKAKLPWKVDDVTTMTDVEASGTMLTYWYLVATYKYKLKDDFVGVVRKGALENLCKTEASLKSMKLGAVYRFNYYDARGKSLGTFDAKAADCG